jgi:hypothetical protein
MVNAEERECTAVILVYISDYVQDGIIRLVLCFDNLRTLLSFVVLFRLECMTLCLRFW